MILNFSSNLCYSVYKLSKKDIKTNSIATKKCGQELLDAVFSFLFNTNTLNSRYDDCRFYIGDNEICEISWKNIQKRKAFGSYNENNIRASLTEFSLTLINSIFEKYNLSNLALSSFDDYNKEKLSINLNDLLNSDIIHTRKIDEIQKAIVSSNVFFICGNSASGKTVATAQALSYAVANGYSYCWIDVSNVNTNPYAFLYTMLNSATSSNHITVIDNIQSMPSCLGWIKNLMFLVKSLIPSTSFSTVLIAWNIASTFIETIYPKIPKIEFLGCETITQFIRMKKLEKYEKAIIKHSMNDVFIAKQIIDHIERTNEYPQESQFAQTIFEQFVGYNHLSQNALKALYVLASMGIFEIHVNEAYLAHLSPAGKNELFQLNLCKQYHSSNKIYISIGHRSLCNQIAIHLSSNPACVSLGKPTSLAIDYLRAEGHSQILSTLERLDLELDSGEECFSNLWRAYCRMRDSLRAQTENDPTWGNNMASMIFAAEAYQNMSFDSTSTSYWERTAKEIRKRWFPNESCTAILQSKEEEPTTESIDFHTNIYQKMLDDEKLFEYQSEMLADNIDYNEFHDNWLLGLLLGFEGLAPDSDTVALKYKYIQCAKSMQCTDGSFYPSRVPWVTARVIMGLCQCGLSYSNEIVRSACNWLISELKTKEQMNWEIDELDCGGWRSGTGVWNSNEQITLMCLCALYSASYPVPRSQEIKQIVDQFWKCRSSLTNMFKKKNTNLDVMWILDVMLYDERNLIDMSTELNHITSFLLKDWKKASLSSEQKESESSDVSFMAKELLTIIWKLLSTNLDSLLDGLNAKPSLDDLKSKKIFISYRREGGSLFAQTIHKRLDAEYKNQVFLDVADLSDQIGYFNELLETAIDNSEIFISIISDHCFDRACSESYDNSKDVFYCENKQAIEQNKKIITVYSCSDPTREAEKLNGCNKDFYDIAVDLSKRQSVLYRPESKSALDELIKDIIIKIKNFNIF